MLVTILDGANESGLSGASGSSALTSRSMSVASPAASLSGGARCDSLSLVRNAEERPPTILIGLPPVVFGNVEQPLVLQAQVEASPEARFVWSFNGRELAADMSRATRIERPHANASCLTLFAPSAGLCELVAYNSSGRVSSQTRILVESGASTTPPPLDARFLHSSASFVDANFDSTRQTPPQTTSHSFAFVADRFAPAAAGWRTLLI